MSLFGRIFSLVLLVTCISCNNVGTSSNCIESEPSDYEYNLTAVYLSEEEQVSRRIYEAREWNRLPGMNFQINAFEFTTDGSYLIYRNVYR